MTVATGLGAPILVLLLLCGVGHSRPSTPDKEIRALVTALREGPQGRRNHAAQRLYHLQDARGNAAVLALAQEEDPATRAIGIRALGVVRPPGAASAIRSALQADDRRVLRAAVEAAGVLRLAGTAPRLKRLLRHPDPLVRRHAIRALARMGPAGLPGLRYALRKGELEQRLVAAAALGTVPGGRARSLLRQAARSGPPEVSLVAARELMRGGQRAGYRAISRLLRSKRKDIRLQAISLLAEHRAERDARRLLAGATRHEDPDIRRSAADALASKPANGD